MQRISDSVFPATRPSSSSFDDILGTFRAGASINGRPVSLDEWRLTTDRPDVAEAVAADLGGTPQEWSTKGKEPLEVNTLESTLPVKIESAERIMASFSLWKDGTLAHRCDGKTRNDGLPCEYADLDPAEHKALANVGRACKPDVLVLFGLDTANLPNIRKVAGDGTFRYRSSAWTLIRAIGAVQDEVERLTANGAPAVGTMSITPVSFVSNGRRVSYNTVTFQFER